MEARHASAEITYNGASIGAQLMGKYGEFTYTDPASGEADSVDIALNDRDRQWITATGASHAAFSSWTTSISPAGR